MSDSAASSSSPSAPADRAARFVLFATLGVQGVVQDLVRLVFESVGRVEGADPELIAEETLVLVATATARAAEVGLRDAPDVAAAAVPALLALPFTYHDYLIGGAILAQGDAALVQKNEVVYARLERKRSFYTVHLPEGHFPGEHALNDKLSLWMGRVSPPGLPETPTERLARLDVLPTLLTHLRLVLAYARKG